VVAQPVVVREVVVQREVVGAPEVVVQQAAQAPLGGAAALRMGEVMTRAQTHRHARTPYQTVATAVAAVTIASAAGASWEFASPYPSPLGRAPCSR
jgi:hypothetical protein